GRGGPRRGRAGAGGGGAGGGTDGAGGAADGGGDGASLSEGETTEFASAGASPGSAAGGEDGSNSGATGAATAPESGNAAASSSMLYRLVRSPVAAALRSSSAVSWSGFLRPNSRIIGWCADRSGGGPKGRPCYHRARTGP